MKEWVVKRSSFLGEWVVYSNCRDKIVILHEDIFVLNVLVFLMGCNWQL